MSLRFIYGRAGSGKSRFCLDEIKQRLTEQREFLGNKQLILIVPEQFSLQAEKELIHSIEATGVTGAEVLSFRRMAYRVFNEVGGVTKPHIHPAGKCMLICRIMDRLADELRVFSKSAKQPGFVKTICNTISELKRYNITPDVLNQIADTDMGEEPSLFQSKLHDVAAIFSEFEKTLHEKYMDLDDDLILLAEKLEQSQQFSGAEIWIDEFSGFTPQEYYIIEKLLKKAERISVTLCTDCLVDESDVDGTGVFAPVRKAVAKLLDIAKRNHIPVEQPVILNKMPFYRFCNSDEMQHLEGQYFSFPYAVYKKETEDVSIFSASNMYTEVEETAREIIALCREKGLRFRDITVVTRNLPAYDKLIQVIFTQYGIPYFIDSKKSVSNHPLVLLILSMLDIFIKNWSYESVFRYLKTGLTNIDVEEIDVIENYVLATGIKGKAWAEPFPQEGLTLYEESMLDQINGTRAKIVEPLLKFRSLTKGRKKIIELCTAVYEFLQEIGVQEKIEQLEEQFRKEGYLNIANQYRQIWNIAMAVLDQLVEVMGDEYCNIERFRNLLETGFGEYEIGLIPPALDQVLVGSVERSKSHEVEALFILGVNDGIFPAVPVDEGILSDLDREVLRSKGVEIAPDTKSKAFEEQYLVYTALTTPRKYLRLSYPIADHEGRTLRPSIIISRVKKIFPNIKELSNVVPKDTIEEELNKIVCPVPTFNELVHSIRKCSDGSGIQPLWKDVYRWYVQHEDWQRHCKTILSGLDYTNRVNYVSPEKIKKLYGNPMYSTVSRLERYASCPFAYYIQYGLKAQERKIFQFSAPDVGSFIHRILECFSQTLEEKNMRWRDLDKEWIRTEVSRIVDEEMKKMPGTVFKGSRRYEYIGNRLKRIVARTVCIIAEQFKRSEFEPLGYELDFGEGGDFPPIVLELPDGNVVKLTGRIDRVDKMTDEEGTYIRVIDYKSGEKAFKLSDVYYGLQIQLMVYLDALFENNKVSDTLLPGGILYFKVDDPIVKGRSDASEEEIERQIMKELRMKGLILADVKLVKAMDKAIDGDSLIIPARINKGDTLGRSSAATKEQFEKIRQHIKNLLLQLCAEILKGNVSISPYKKKKITSCAYCNYSSICQFDPMLPDNKYRILRDMDDDEIWKQLM